MSESTPQWFLKSIRVWQSIDGHMVDPGWWYLRTRSGPRRLAGWRLVLRRILWGFQGLVDTRINAWEWHPFTNKQGV